MAKKRAMALPSGWILLRVCLRGIVLVVGLCWFVHENLSNRSTISKQEEIEPFLTRLARKANVTEHQVMLILEELGPAMNREFAKGNRIHLPGLGDFQVELAPGYLKHNPQSDRYQSMPPAHMIHFHPIVPAGTHQQKTPGGETVPGRVIN